MKKMLMLLFAMIIAVGSFAAVKAEAAPPLPPPPPPNGVITVRMDGMAPAGKESQAIEAGKDRAVFRVFSHITRPDGDPNSAFAQIMRRHNDYVISYKVVQKRQVGKDMQVILDVVIDAPKLMQDFSAIANAQQGEKQNRSMIARTIVRTVGVANQDMMDEKVMTDFANRFANLGFKTQFSGDAMEKIRMTRQLPYPAFEQDVINSIKSHDLMVRFAVIGEIRMVSVAPNPMGNGYYGKASITVRSIDMKSNGLVDAFEDEYSILGNTADEAERLVVQKASIDSAEKMAQRTLAYWRSSN